MLKPVILAAGGVLCRSTGEVALIQRPRYDDEWSLPKGKLEKGETFEEAAVREIEEETNCRGEIVGFLGAIDYFVKERPKVVVYYRIEVREEREFAANEEVSRIEWLPPEEALSRLDHEQEKAILRRFGGYS